MGEGKLRARDQRLPRRTDCVHIVSQLSEYATHGSRSCAYLSCRSKRIPEAEPRDSSCTSHAWRFAFATRILPGLNERPTKLGGKPGTSHLYFARAGPRGSTVAAPVRVWDAGAPVARASVHSNRRIRGHGMLTAVARRTC